MSGGFFNFNLGGSSSPTPPVSAFPRLGARLAFASPAGGAVAAAPPGFSADPTVPTGRLLVTLTANTTWISLTAGYDGQFLDVNIVAGNFLLTLPSADFGGFGDLNIPLNGHILLYYDATNALWQRATP